MQEFDPGPILDEEQSQGDHDIEPMDLDESDEDQNPSHVDRLLISVDFGTTFSCVAYTRVRKGERSGGVNISQIKCINKFKDYKPRGEMAQMREDVPTELWYNPETDEVENDAISIGDYPTRRAAHYWKSAYPDSDQEDEPETPREVRSQQRIREDQSKPSRPRCWGFGVQNQLKKVDIPKQEEGRISRFKLLLDKSSSTKEIRRGLQPILKSLKKNELIQTENDVFTHYITHLLENARAQLEEKGELEDDPFVEFILCVPAKWPIKGSRILQHAMEKAVKEAGFGTRAQDSVSNLFLVTEPEAAAACVLAENLNSIYFNEVILILDAGGGTVDAVTYGVTSEEPLRLNAEVVPPDSELCGASFINQRFERLLLERLQDETYLIKNGKTLESIVEALSIVFENGEKRSIDTEDKYSELDTIWIDDLKANRQKGFQQNRIILTREDMKLIFRDSLRGTKQLLNRQLELSEGKEKMVQKVLLTGGFGQSPSLQHYLRDYLNSYNKEKQMDIGLLIPRSPSTAVAKGAILRALKKANGPERIIQCSYGFLRDELYDPETHPEHKRAKANVDEGDGKKYVVDTIDWLISAGDRVPSRKVVKIDVKHTFALDKAELKCVEELYVSEKKHQSHYKKRNANNKGAELAGSIVADMTFLRDQGHIRPEGLSQSEASEKPHWAVNFELFMIVEGRNLRYQARWPMEKDLHAGQRPGIQAQGQICIAAAFQPGTA